MPRPSLKGETAPIFHASSTPFPGNRNRNYTDNVTGVRCFKRVGDSDNKE